MTGRHAAIFAALLLGLGAVVVAWVSVDRRPSEWDHANHLERAVACHRSLSEPAREGWWCCAVRVRWTLPGPDLSARLTLQTGPGHDPFSIHADTLRYGGIRLPGLLVDWVVRTFDPTPRLRRLPMAVALAPVYIGQERLEIGEAKDTGATCPPGEPR